MTLAASIFEIRPGATGAADTNGGGFIIGASGTDYSQQNSPQYNYTNLASSNGTTNPSVVTSASHNFVAADVGNVINISAGSNWTAGFYQIVSCSSNAATLDRACGTSASLSSGTFAVGGALNTVNKFTALTSTTMGTAGHHGYVKANGTISVSAATTFAFSGAATTPCILEGYTTTRGDGGVVTLQLSSTSVSMFSVNNAVVHWFVRNFILDCNSKNGSTGFSATSDNTSVTLSNVRAKNFTTAGFSTSGTVSMFGCGADGGTSAATAAWSDAVNDNSALRKAIGCSFSGNSCPGVVFSGAGELPEIIWCIIANNSGASSDGVRLSMTAGSLSMTNSIIYSNGRDGIRFAGTGAPWSRMFMLNLIIVGNSGWGINSSVDTLGSYPAFPSIDYNAFASNSSGTYNNLPAGAHDVTLSGDPFTNGSGGNFSLLTSGYGSPLLGAGFPASWLSLSTTSYPDIGAVIPQFGAGGAPLSRVFTGM